MGGNHGSRTFFNLLKQLGIATLLPKGYTVITQLSYYGFLSRVSEHTAHFLSVADVNTRWQQWRSMGASSQQCVCRLKSR